MLTGSRYAREFLGKDETRSNRSYKISPGPNNSIKTEGHKCKLTSCSLNYACI